MTIKALKVVKNRQRKGISLLMNSLKRMKKVMIIVQRKQKYLSINIDLKWPIVNLTKEKPFARQMPQSQQEIPTLKLKRTIRKKKMIN
jgi:hydrogenase maturation factor HypF (carbamoyltransferase family)